MTLLRATNFFDGVWDGCRWVKENLNRCSQMLNFVLEQNVDPILRGNEQVFGPLEERAVYPLNMFKRQETLQCKEKKLLSAKRLLAQSEQNVFVPWSLFNLPTQNFTTYQSHALVLKTFPNDLYRKKKGRFKTCRERARCIDFPLLTNRKPEKKGNSSLSRDAASHWMS